MRRRVLRLAQRDIASTLQLIAALRAKMRERVGNGEGPKPWHAGASFPLSSFERMYNQLQKGERMAPVTVVKGLDAYALPSSTNPAVLENTVWQVASQFNFLESISSNYTKSEDCFGDQTQGPRASLHVTLVQGVFNNPPEVLKYAFEALFDAVNGFNVHVYIHGFMGDDVAKIKAGLGDGVAYNEMTKEEFMGGQ